jgi:protein XagA
MSPFAREAQASAFLQPPGQGDIITAAEFSDSTRAFDQNGKLIPIPAGIR